MDINSEEFKYFFLDIDRLSAFLGLLVSQVRPLMKRKDFPKYHKFTRECRKVYRREEVLNWARENIHKIPFRDLGQKYLSGMKFDEGFTNN